MQTSKVFVAIGCMICVRAYGQNEVNDPRPLLAAINQLQATYGVAINYEDPPFQFAGDSEDVTDKVQRPEQRAANPSVRIRIPRGGPLRWTPALIRQGNVADATPTVAQLLTLYQNEGYPGRFQMLHVSGAISVVPVAIKTERGEWHSVSPMFSTNVSIEARDRSAGELIEEILRQVSQRRGVKIGLAVAPIGMLSNVRTSIGLREVPAATILNDLFQEITRQAQPSGQSATSLITYRLLFDPGQRYYLLTLAPVPVKLEVEDVPPARSSGGTFGGAIQSDGIFGGVAKTPQKK